MSNITSNDFELVDSVDETFYAVKMLTGPYEGVKFQYGRVTIREEGDEGILSYNYEVDGHEELKNDKEFEKTVGDVLSIILTEAFESGNYKIGDLDESTVDSNNNP